MTRISLRKWGLVAVPLLATLLAEVPVVHAQVLNRAIAIGRVAATLASGKPGGEAKGPKFSEDTEKTLAKLMSEMKLAKVKYWTDRTKHEVDDIVANTGLGAEGAKALETSAAPVIDECVQEWLEKTEAFLRKSIATSEQAFKVKPDEMPQLVNMYVSSNMFGTVTPPNKRPAWEQALKRTLTAEQDAKWEKLIAQREQEFEEQVGGLLKGMDERQRDQTKAMMQPTVTSIDGVLGLSHERRAQLEALAEAAVKKSGEGWIERAKEELRSLEPEARRRIVKAGRYYRGLDDDDYPDHQAVWKEGLAKLLTAEEMKRLDDDKENRKARRAQVVGRLLVAEMDRKVAFTSSQRERLEPLMERIAKADTTLTPDDKNPNARYFSIMPQMLWTAAKGATAEDIKPILDDLQWKHWQVACNAKSADSDEDNEPLAKPNAAKTDDQPAPASEPEDFEIEVSKFLEKKTSSERLRVLESMVVMAEDIVRVAGLSPEVSARLHTAARGATEKVVDEWSPRIERMIREEARGCAPTDLPGRLAAIQEYRYLNERIGIPQAESIWQKTMKAELKKPETDAWKKVQDERAAYEQTVISQLVLEDFDRQTRLTSTQLEKLKPMVDNFLKEYREDLGSYFSYSNDGRWYLQAYSALIPIASIPEKDLKEILSKDQYDSWTGSPMWSNCSMYWNNLEANHAQRKKMREQQEKQ